MLPPFEVLSDIVAYAIDQPGVYKTQIHPHTPSLFIDVPTALALCRASPVLNSLVQPLLYENVSLTRPSALTLFFQTISRRPALGRLVKSLWIGHSDTLPEHCWSLYDHPDMPFIISAIEDPNQLPLGIAPHRSWATPAFHGDEKNVKALRRMREFHAMMHRVIDVARRKAGYDGRGVCFFPQHPEYEDKKYVLADANGSTCTGCCWRMRISGSSREVSLAEWTLRVYEVQAKVDDFLRACRRMEDLQGFSPATRRIMAKLRSPHVSGYWRQEERYSTYAHQLEHSEMPWYPDSPPHFHPDGRDARLFHLIEPDYDDLFAELSSEQVIMYEALLLQCEREFVKTSDIRPERVYPDRFDHPLLFALSGLTSTKRALDSIFSRPRTGAPKEYEQVGFGFALRLADPYAAVPTGELDLPPSSGSERAPGSGRPYNGNKKKAAKNLLHDRLPKERTVGGLLETAQKLLRLTPDIEHLGLTGFFVRSIAGTCNDIVLDKLKNLSMTVPECPLSDFIWHPDHREPAALRLDNVSLRNVQRLQVEGALTWRTQYLLMKMLSLKELRWTMRRDDPYEYECWFDEWGFRPVCLERLLGLPYDPENAREKHPPTEAHQTTFTVRAFFSEQGVWHFNEYASKELKNHPRLSVQAWGSDRGDKNVPRKLKGPDPSIEARGDQTCPGGVYEVRRMWEEWIAEDRR